MLLKETHTRDTVETILFIDNYICVLFLMIVDVLFKNIFQIIFGKNYFVIYN